MVAFLWMQMKAIIHGINKLVNSLNKKELLKTTPSLLENN